MEEAYLGQLLLMGIPGPELDADTAKRLKALQAGGYIIFGRNIKSPEQLRKLIDDLRDLSEVEPIITIDQEGGRVSRLRLIGQEPPNAQDLRKKNERGLIRKHGELTGRILRLFGFNLDLCPVLDICFDEEADNSLLGRCYGTTADEVIEKAGLFNAALRQEGILTCGKHFPGYSRADCDAHHELPVISLSKEELETHELAPFRALAPSLDSMMTCHSHYTAYDPDRERWPASLSENLITQVLRNQLDYKGLIMTDDLDMGAIINEVGFKEAILQAVRAGNDMVMICHRVEMVEEAKEHLKELPHPVLDDALRSIEKAKEKIKAPHDFSLDEFEEINREIWQLRVDTMGEERAKILSVEDGKRSPVETY